MTCSRCTKPAIMQTRVGPLCARHYMRERERVTDELNIRRPSMTHRSRWSALDYAMVVAIAGVLFALAVVAAHNPAEVAGDATPSGDAVGGM